MKNWSCKALSNTEGEIVRIIATHFKSFYRTSSKYSEVFMADIYMARISSTLSVTLYLETEDLKNYGIHIIAAGGKTDYLPSISWWAESSELGRIKKMVIEELESAGIQIIGSNADYYGFP